MLLPEAIRLHVLLPEAFTKLWAPLPEANTRLQALVTRDKY